MSTWSTEVYVETGDAVCPTCSYNQYYTRELGGNLYKKSTDCGRVSSVTEADNLVLLETEEG